MPRELSPWCLAKLAESLPEGAYKLAQGEPGPATLGWLLAQHRFDAYRSKKDDAERGPRVLVTGEPARIEPSIRQAEAVALVRDLVNTPAGDLGPAELERAVREQAERIGAEVRVTSGKDLDEGYPLVAAVGRAASPDRAPRLIELEWGRPDHPRVAIIGKGVCFDSGGLDLKPASGMRLMKKDMGGAAHALALATPDCGRTAAGAAAFAHSRGGKCSVGQRLPARRRGQVAAGPHGRDRQYGRRGPPRPRRRIDQGGRVRAGADRRFRDADRRGAHRLGPDLPALFCNDDAFADELAKAGKEATDPLWRMPIWDAYDEMLKSDVADMANAAGSPMAGAVVAAMFLKKFVPKDVPWAHFDTYAWRDKGKPGRPKGGEALGLRAVFAVLSDRYTRS